MRVLRIVFLGFLFHHNLISQAATNHPKILLDGGSASLKHAIELGPDHDDRMARLNLLYRRKADTANYQDDRDGLLKMADDLVDKVKEIKRTRTEQPTRPSARKEFTVSPFCALPW